MKQNSSQWMPFNSLFNGNEEKDKIVVINKKKPILSEEQIEAIENKKILIIDELDSSLHFKITRAIISMFNNEINKNAQ